MESVKINKLVDGGISFYNPNAKRFERMGLGQNSIRIKYEDLVVALYNMDIVDFFNAGYVEIEDPAVIVSLYDKEAIELKAYPEALAKVTKAKAATSKPKTITNKNLDYWFNEASRGDLEEALKNATDAAQRTFLSAAEKKYNNEATRHELSGTVLWAVTDVLGKDLKEMSQNN